MKGQRGFPILAPIVKELEQQDADTRETKERKTIVGFKHAIVFGFDQTDGEPLPPADPDVAAWLDNLPLVDVAREWGLMVDAYNGREGAALGNRRGQGIAVGVKNIYATWAHELVHAADDLLGHLVERGQHWRSNASPSWAAPRC